MKNYLSSLEKNQLKNLNLIGRQADQKRVKAYVVGGFVRDLLLKKRNLDLDVVVEGDAIPLARSFAQRHQASFKSYQQFGTATVSFKNGLRIDFATARKERYPRSGALPVVKRGSIKDDLFRRDFTVNAMAIGINSDRFGEMVDFFDGYKDLKKGKIRILHHQSFVDDPTRILRAVRFEQRFGFGMERQTLTLLKVGIKKNLPSRVKPERYFAEFKKGLMEQKPTKFLLRLYRLGGLNFLGRDIKPNFSRLSLIERNINTLNKKKGFQNKKCWWLLYFMGLVCSLPRLTLEKALDRFNFKKTDREAVRHAQRSDRIVKQLGKGGLKPSQVFNLLDNLGEEAILFLRVRTSSRVVAKRIDEFQKKFSQVKLNINGHDIKRLGVPQGDRIKKMLRYLLYLKIDGIIRSRKDELLEARRVI